VCINCVYFYFFVFFLNVWVLLPFDGEIKMYILGGALRIDGRRLSIRLSAPSRTEGLKFGR